MSKAGGERWAAALRDGRPKEYWQDLADYLGVPPEAGEFPAGADERPDGLSRRDFMTLLGASMALAGASGCAVERPAAILPYNDQPENLTPGLSSQYATSMVVDGHATGLLVESREGRPVKIEGNPGHPASLGATSAAQQASLLGLYDPNRARALRRGNAPASWRRFAAGFGPGADGRLPAGRIHFLMEPVSSPLLIDQVRRIRQRHPLARFHFHAPAETGAATRGARAAFGRPLAPVYDLGQADVILSLDADFLAEGPSHLRLAREFARRRRVESRHSSMNRLYVAETHFTPTGSTADHRLRLAPRDLAAFAHALAARIVLAEGSREKVPAGLRARLEQERAGAPAGKWLEAVAKDLVQSGGRSLILAGPRQPAEVHALVHLMNAALGNAGETVRYIEPVVFEEGEDSHGLGALVAALDAGEVEALVILGGNPVYTAPPALELEQRLAKAGARVYLGLYENETAKVCEWFVPQAHYLESWGDARAYDGTHSVIQPLIRPLFQGRTEAQVLEVFLGGSNTAPRALLEAHWLRSQGPGPGLDQAIRRGFVEGTAHPALEVRLVPAGIEALLAERPERPAPGGFELALRVDPKLHDGRFANNAWLLELPEPVTSLTWDNAALVSPRSAEALGVQDGDVVQLTVGGRQVRAPVLVEPGHADQCVTLSLGWGRRGEEAVARGLGANAYLLRTPDQPWFSGGVEVVKTGAHKTLALTQQHRKLHGRDVLQHTTLEAYRKNPDFLHDLQVVTPTLRAAWPAEGVQWGMAVDLSLCTGCSACVVACQAENNIPVVGEVDVRKGREMHWLRIDRYFAGAPEDPELLVQPMMCQHCERAPCEYVCPVNATVHSPDGLNEMVYNRCVGTRFCSNNCPYKVRRFNYFDYNENKTPTERMVLNPEVTPRARGVMEKCTYCVQRIRRAQIGAKVKGETLEPTTIVSACQQACPTEAIVFGPISDPEAQVTRQSASERAYKALNATGTEPRTRYLARITNPNPELEA